MHETSKETQTKKSKDVDLNRQSRTSDTQIDVNTILERPSPNHDIYKKAKDRFEKRTRYRCRPDITELRDYRKSLEITIEHIDRFINDRIRKNLFHIQNGVKAHLAFEKVCYKQIVRDAMIEIINKIAEFYNTEEMVRKILLENEKDDTIENVYTIKFIMKKFREKIHDDNIETYNKDEIYVHINLKNNLLTFMINKSILSEITLCKIVVDDRIYNLFENDFIFKIDITEMKFFIFENKINDQIQLFKKIIMLGERDIEILNHEKKNYIMIKEDCMLNDEFIKVSKNFIYEIESLVNELDPKRRFLILSFFLIINPGLIELFEIDKYRKERGFYYLKWLEK